MIGRQEALQTLCAPSDVGLDCSQRQVGDFRNFTLGHSLVVGQDDAQAHGTRQRGEGTIQIDCQTWLGALCWFSVVYLICVQQGILLTQMLEPDCDGQSLQPGTKLARLAQVPNVSPGVQKHLLSHIVSQNDITATTPHQIAYPGLATANKFRKCVMVAIARQSDHQCLRIVRIGVSFWRHELFRHAFDSPGRDQQTGPDA